MEKKMLCASRKCVSSHFLPKKKRPGQVLASNNEYAQFISTLYSTTNICLVVVNVFVVKV